MNSLKFIFRYLKYIFISNNRHYIQSSFVYNFVTNVITTKTKDKSCTDIELLRRELILNNNKIQITDFGSGSKINSAKERRISDIAKNSAKTTKYGKLLYRIIKYYQPKKILELGSSLGISTCYLATGNPGGNVLTIEGCPETAKLALKNFHKMKLKNIKLEIGNFDNKLTSALERLNEIDFAFIDGNHQKQQTINYFEQCLEFSNNNTIMVFDDIHWSKGMEIAWDYIKTHSKTTVTIDLFFVGIVFINTELSKEHFIIRI